MPRCSIWKTIICLGFWPVAAALAGDDAPTPDRRPLIGFRVQCMGSQFFNTTSVQTSTTKPDASYTYTANTDHSQRCFPSAAAEYGVWRRLTVGLEFQFYHPEYTQTTTILNGTPPGPGQGDSRTTTTITQQSKLNYWQLPLILRYYGAPPEQELVRPYVAGGLEYRHVGRIRTGTTYVYPDGTSDYNEVPATANATNLAGVVIGCGLRFGNHSRWVKVAPEFRYIRWLGTAMRGTAFRSSVNQVEIGMGFSF
jgi:hypothetical protein